MNCSSTSPLSMAVFSYVRVSAADFLKHGSDMMCRFLFNNFLMITRRSINSFTVVHSLRKTASVVRPINSPERPCFAA